MSLSTTTVESPSLLRRLERWQWLLPVGSFVAGWVSYVAIERGPSLARVIALTVLLSWLWLLLEGVAGRAIHALSRGRVPAGVAGFVTQSLQQELLFFTLPFAFGAAQLDIGHGLFMAALCAAALLSTLDPLYERWIIRRPVSAVAFQGYCAWVTALVLLPVALRLPVEQSAQAAGAVALLALVVALPRLWGTGLGWMGAVKGAGLLLLAVVLMIAAAPWLPPVGLRLTQARLTTGVQALAPGAPLQRVPLAQLRQQGLVAFAAVHAPRGLTQQLFFDWIHEGQRVDRIPAVIQGTEGEQRGWRTWTRKQNFDADPRGRWRVDIRTAGGQLVGRLPFSVTD